MPPKTAYEALKEAGKCVRKCGRAAVTGKTHCDECSLRQVYSVINRNSRERGGDPLGVPADVFVIWYRERRGGPCEWCGEPFGKFEPRVNHAAGEPRALVCALCATAADVGLERLRKVVVALENWERGARRVAVSPSYKLESNFERWAGYIERYKTGRDDRTNKVVREIRARVSSQEDVERYFNALRVYMDNRKGA